MCVLALAWRAHPRWRLVLAGNRDELHARPAEPLHRWAKADHVLAGRDIQSGGAWLGVSERGRLAVVTNLAGFGPPQTGRPSRGDLVKDFLIGEGPYAALSPADAGQFNPFNLIVCDGEQASFWSNRPRAQRPLAPGLYGLSNGDLDEPWPKTFQLKSALSDWLAAGASGPQSLLDVLRDESEPPAGPGPRSPIFIRDGRYGTRCSTVVAIDQQGHGLIVECRFDAKGEDAGETALSFFWQL